MFARVLTVMLTVFAVTTLRSVAIIVDRFEVPVTFRALLPKIEEAFRVVTLLVNRLEVPLALKVAAKRLTAFMIAALPLV